MGKLIDPFSPSPEDNGMLLATSNQISNSANVGDRRLGHQN